MIDDQYQELINIYEDNPNYKIQVEEFKNNLINVSSVIHPANEEIARILDLIRIKNELCLYNLNDLKDGRISQEIFMHRVSDDIRSSEDLIKRALERIKANDSVIKLLTLLSNRGWDLNPQSEIKCLIKDCKDCVNNWNQNKELGKKEENDSMDFCFNKCLWCNRQRKNRAHVLNDNINPSSDNGNIGSSINLGLSPPENNIMKQPDNKVYLEIASVSADQSVKTITNKLNNTVINQAMLLNDKYFFVELTSERRDGANDYVTQILIKNFKQMFPPSYSALAFIYNVSVSDHCHSDAAETSVTKSPILYGMIRFNHRNKHNITVKSTHIKNEIKSSSGVKSSRYYSVTNLTKYIAKQYVTSRSIIIEKYKFITENDAGSDTSSVGNPLDDFLA